MKSKTKAELIEENKVLRRDLVGYTKAKKEITALRSQIEISEGMTLFRKEKIEELENYNFKIEKQNNHLLNQSGIIRKDLLCANETILGLRSELNKTDKRLKKELKKRLIIQSNMTRLLTKNLLK